MQPRRTLHSEQRAHKGRAKHGVEWLRLQLLASRGARCPLPLCILGIAHHWTLACGHMLEEARGPGGRVGGIELHLNQIIFFYFSQYVVSAQSQRTVQCPSMIITY